MHQKHPVPRFSFQTNWMKNKKLEKWFVTTLETIFLSATFLLMTSLKSRPVLSKVKECTYKSFTPLN